MAKNRAKLARLLGARIVEELPDVAGGAFGMARMAHLLHQRLTPSQGERPGRPTNPSWVVRPKVPMSEATAKKLAQIAKVMSTAARKVSPMQVAAQLLEETVNQLGGLKSQMQSGLKKRASKTGVGENIAGMFQWVKCCKLLLGNGVPAMASHLTMEERDRIAQLRHQGVDQQEIARTVGRCPSTISRELRRNCVGEEYYAAQAHHAAERRRRERPLVRKMEDPRINATVRAGLGQEWAPEQVVGRMKEQDPEGRDRRVSPQTIYAWIKRDPSREHWEARLRRRGKRPWRPKNAASTGAASDAPVFPLCRGGIKQPRIPCDRNGDGPPVPKRHAHGVFRELHTGDSLVSR